MPVKQAKNAKGIDQRTQEKCKPQRSSCALCSLVLPHGAFPISSIVTEVYDQCFWIE